MNQEFMKKKPILPLVISMALPMTISMLVNALYNIVDGYFVAKISEDAMTALSLVFPLQNVLTAITVGFGIGINAVVAFYLGANDKKNADTTASLGMFFNIIHGIVLTVLFLTTIPVFLKLFTGNKDVISSGMQYFYVVFSFCIPVSISMTFEKTFQAVGRMKVSMICMMAGCVTNIILDPLFIFGAGFIPAMGIKGAAIATVTGQCVTLLAYFLFYTFSPVPVRFSLKEVHFDGKICKELYSIGIPAGLNMALPSLQVFVLNKILSVYQGGYVLVLGSYYKLQTFLYLTANGVVQGMRPVLSFNYGAGEHKRVRNIFICSLSIIGIVMTLGTILCLIAPDRLIGIFSSNPDTIAIGVRAIRIISIGFIVSSIPVTISGALEALGKGISSLIISILRYIGIMLLLACILNKVIGAQGVWHSFWITEFITAFAAVIIYKKTFKKS